MLGRLSLGTAPLSAPSSPFSSGGSTASSSTPGALRRSIYDAYDDDEQLPQQEGLVGMLSELELAADAAVGRSYHGAPAASHPEPASAPAHSAAPEPVAAMAGSTVSATTSAVVAPVTPSAPDPSAVAVAVATQQPTVSDARLRQLFAALDDDGDEHLGPAELMVDGRRLTLFEYAEVCLRLGADSMVGLDYGAFQRLYSELAMGSAAEDCAAVLGDDAVYSYS